MFYANDLRDNAANWIVEPENFYKGASKVTIDSVVKTGYYKKLTYKELSNGIVKVTSGSTTDQSRFTLSFYDNGTYGSSREIAISRGSAETEWNVWQTVQIMRNEPQEVAVRFTTYSEDSYGDGRLTVDVTEEEHIMHHLLCLKVVLVQINKPRKNGKTNYCKYNYQQYRICNRK